MAEQTSNGFPMISEKNWWTLRDKFKASLPAAATPNYIKTLLTLSSDSSANSNVITPMKRLGLLDDDNKPTPLANDWRLDNKYKEACNIMVEQVYPQELLDLFPDSEVDRATARNWFMGKGVGQGAADKMVALFILLKSGSIKEKKTATPVRENKKPTKPKTKEDQEAPVEIKVNSSQEGKSSIRPNLHIDLQIHISPDSTPEQIDAIFASMAKHLYGTDK
nr:DUF5343 domain-containing protein [uncultured Oscillibacter sp.]